MKSNASLSLQVTRQLRDCLFIDSKLHAEYALIQPAHTVSAKPHLLLALSGGIDSVVLLHVLHGLANEIPFHLSAMHVHHGLSTQADDWLHFCQQLCAELVVPFYHAQVDVDTQTGYGVESAARTARYQALADTATQIAADYLVTAHHMFDQSETLLLQLLRGAGLKGLSSMALHDTERHLIRPLLGVSRHEIELYAQTHQLQWVEDDSNQDSRYERNFIRLKVMPQLRERYPHMDETLARSARHIADAQTLLDVLAAQDLQSCVLQEEWMGQSIALAAFSSLGAVRAKNLLRHWFQQQKLLMPSRDQLEEYWQQLSEVKPHRYLHLPLRDLAHQQAVFLHHYQGRLYCVRQPKALPESPLEWQGTPSQDWENWKLSFSLVKGKGIAVAKLGIRQADITLHLRYQKPMLLPAGSALLVHARSGGEVLQPDSKRPRRDLKVIFQSISVPPWQRALCPLVSVRLRDQETPILIGLLPKTINHSWRPSRNAYGLVIQITPLAV